MLESLASVWVSWSHVLTPVVTLLVTLGLGFIVRKVLFNRLSHWAGMSKTDIDDIIVCCLSGPSIIWIFILGIYLAVRFSQLPENITALAGKTLLVLAIISFTLVVANLTVRFIQKYSGRVDTTLPVSSLTQNITRGIIFALGILIILASLNLNITPLLATLGVGGLAVALALQDTLSNLFAGFYITVAKQIQIGDYIKLDSGEEGYVTDIHWRTIKIRMLANNVILVPNEKLAKAIVTNYHLPENELAVLINLGVHYNSDLDKVEKVTVEVARSVMKEVEGGVPGFEPFIRYNEFGDSSINFTVIMRAKEFTDQYPIKHEFIKRLVERYRAEDIVIPFPIRAINYQQEAPGTKPKL